MADEVILLPVYPARELPIEGVTSEMILNKMKKDNAKVMGKEELINWIRNDYIKNVNKESGRVLITAGAGDIDTLVGPIKKILTEKI
jgi:UDP-N-acetylmuramate--alanine ligase